MSAMDALVRALAQKAVADYLAAQQRPPEPQQAATGQPADLSAASKAA